MKKLAAFLILLGAIAPVYADGTPKTAAGLWSWDDGTQRKAWVFIIERDGSYDAFVVKTFPAFHGPRTDEIARPLIKGLQRGGTDYTDGAFSDPWDGKQDRASLELSADGNTLTIVDSAHGPAAGRDRFYRLPDEWLREVRHLPMRLPSEDRRALKDAKSKVVTATETSIIDALTRPSPDILRQAK